MTRELIITELADIIAAVNILLKNDSAVNPGTISKYGREIVSEIGMIPENLIGEIKNVAVTYDNGQKSLPTKITIPWERAEIVVKARDTDTEDLVRRLVDDRFNALVRGTHSKLTNGQLFDKETVDELRLQLDIANNSCAVLQMREAAANNELAEMRDAADRTKRAHQKDIAQLNATIKSLQSINRYTEPTGTVLDAYHTLAKQDEIACRLILKSAINLFPEDCEDLKRIADFDLATYHFNDKPERVKNYIHAMLDNLIAAGTLHQVTRQMMYAMHNEANQVNRPRVEIALRELSPPDRVIAVHDVANKDIERAYKEFRDIVNCEGAIHE
ncbi:hypothetical protein JT350_gp22 [Salmonella phage SAP012]|uniref:Uncharacterized protein n=1 Tax=Salmonella phage SAP012 TaxID=2742114 RepID=A0A6J4EG92_9CAUD|nr:hypothetical protein JT350_gp22 [Salmonella phage SAP012]BCG45185.1 hypothetical protein [Salmonella phage SAP012]